MIRIKVIKLTNTSGALKVPLNGYELNNVIWVRPSVRRKSRGAIRNKKRAKSEGITH
jgi:hypothetical protein